MSKHLCACKCGTRITGKNNKGKRGGRKFAPGHNQFRTESAERNLAVHNARNGRKPPKVNLYKGRTPSRIRPRTIHHEL